LHKVDEKKVALAKADKALNETGRMLFKAELAEKFGLQMINSSRHLARREADGLRMGSDGASSPD
jgi:hypothetical protein